jgi:hypothetical protein
MPWYATAYVVFLLVVGGASTREALAARRAAAFVAADGLVSLIWAMFVVIYYRPALAVPAPATGLLLVGAIAWSVAETRRELAAAVAARPESADPGLSSRANRWIDRGVEAGAVVAGWMLVVPAGLAAFALILRG